MFLAFQKRTDDDGDEVEQLVEKRESKRKVDNRSVLNPSIWS